MINLTRASRNSASSNLVWKRDSGTWQMMSEDSWCRKINHYILLILIFDFYVILAKSHQSHQPHRLGEFNREETIDEKEDSGGNYRSCCDCSGGSSFDNPHAHRHQAAEPRGVGIHLALDTRQSWPSVIDLNAPPHRGGAGVGARRWRGCEACRPRSPVSDPSPPGEGRLESGPSHVGLIRNRRRNSPRAKALAKFSE
jgi:hypothetical protein